MAGPTRRAALNDAEFSETALGRSFSETSYDTNAWRAGASIAETTPSAKANA